MTAVDRRDASGLPLLSAAQVRYIDTFGYLHLPGLFADDVAEIIEDFDRIMADDGNLHLETRERIHFGQRRVTVPDFVNKGTTLRNLPDDPRVRGVLASLLGPDSVWEGSDGNHFYCETSWHNDVYGADLSRANVKLTFYLDPLTFDRGAIRVVPGSHHRDERYSRMLRSHVRAPEEIRETLGVAPDEIPSWPIETEPGDLLVWWYTTMHGSFGSTERRRLFSMDYSADSHAAEEVRRAIAAS